ncbi:MAG: AMP-binding protein, partial [Candidatus Marinimicrobia bacterium]|nr:AMP-binding protein [Candidatus Neomarinimicrobiota bacterium]
MNYQLDYLKTMPEVFADALLGGTDRKLLNVKRNNEWVSFTYQDINETIPRIGFGFHALGLKQKDRVGILSENRPEWNMTDLACAHFNFTSVPVYHTCIPKQIEFILNHAEVKILIVSSKEQADKVIAIKSALKTLKYMIILNDEKFDDNWIISWEDFLKKGDIAKEESKTSMQEIAAKVKPEDLYSIIYTSGTSGDPKGVMISQFNMASNVQQSQAALGFKKDKKWLSFLPLSHSFERVTSLFSTWIGAEIYFAESIAKVAENLKEVQPQYMTTAPRLLEKVYAAIQEQVAIGSPIKQNIFRWAQNVGHDVVSKYLSFNKKPQGLLATRYALAKKL